MAIRALRALPREPEVMIPSLIIPVFFFAVNIGTLQDFAERGIPGLDFRAFQLPTAIVFAVTGISRAPRAGDRHPVRLLRPDADDADAAVVAAARDDGRRLRAGRWHLTLPVIALGFAVGVGFETGSSACSSSSLLAGLWGLVFTGFPYAIALKTGSPGAVGASFILFFPFAFLTTATLPQGGADRLARHHRRPTTR